MLLLLLFSVLFNLKVFLLYIPYSGTCSNSPTTEEETCYGCVRYWRPGVSVSLEMVAATHHSKGNRSCCNGWTTTAMWRHVPEFLCNWLLR